MAVTITLQRTIPEDAEAVAVPVFRSGLAEVGIDEAFAAARGFEGKLGQSLTLPALAGSASIDGGPDRLHVAVGMGDPADLDPHAFRRAGAALARASSRLSRVATTVLDAAAEHGVDRPAAAQALAEGVHLASYRFTTYKSDPTPSRLDDLVVVGSGGAKVTRGLEVGEKLAAAVCLARDLVNEPGGEMTPTVFAEAAREVAEREGLSIVVLDEEGIVARRLGGLLGVNRGSVQPPRFVELTYEPEKPRGSLALVGKGITFDSGGLSLKTADGMMTMKNDMGGAAAVLGAMSVLRAVGVRAKVTAYIPLTDNMTGGDATRPGDVLRIRNGTTVEVLNTDAEGRLVLADALSLASEAAPDAIVDLATLTGACVVGLGSTIAGLMGNHDGWIDVVRSAADRVGERVWPLPLPEGYRTRIDSDVADIKNHASTRDGGAMTAGVFLREFVGDGIPWVHLDIAGPAWAGADDAEITKGGTGFGVRMLAELARDFRRPR